MFIYYLGVKKRRLSSLNYIIFVYLTFACSTFVNVAFLVPNYFQLNMVGHLEPKLLH